MNYSTVIFKNDKIGDLIHCFLGIKRILDKDKDKKILIYLSKYNYEMKFLFDDKNVEIKSLSKKLSLIEKINILFFFLLNNIEKTFIFKPSSFLFTLPFIFYFKKIKFYAICIDKFKYHRPSKFLRQFLTKYVINDRGSKIIRKPILNLYLDLIDNVNNSNVMMYYDFKNRNNFKNKLPKDYILIHYNKLKFNYLGWSLDDLDKILNKVSNKYNKIVLTNDINDTKTNHIFSKKYENTDVIYLPNISGKLFFDVIGNSKLVIALHGMITAIAAIQNVNVLDLFYCKIENLNDLYRYKNSFHEFKPKKKKL